MKIHEDLKDDLKAALWAFEAACSGLKECYMYMGAEHIDGLVFGYFKNSYTRETIKIELHYAEKKE